MKYFSLFIVILICSCASKYEGIYVESIPSELSENKNRFDLDNKIYTLNKTVLYSFSIYKNEALIPSDIKFIRMTIIGTTEPFSKFDSSYSQTVIKYEYLDVANKSLATEKNRFDRE